MRCNSLLALVAGGSENIHRRYRAKQTVCCVRHRNRDEFLYRQTTRRQDSPCFYRKFVPARLTDNPFLMADGQYEAMLLSLPEVERKRLLEGDWDVAEGAAFLRFFLVFDTWSSLSNYLPTGHTSRRLRLRESFVCALGCY